MKRWLLVVFVALLITSVSGFWTVSGITSPPPPRPVDPTPPPIEIIILTATPTTGYAPLAVTFQLKENASLSEIAWYFGDGSPVQYGGFTTTHTYSAPGSYTATVSALYRGTIDLGAARTITVNPKPNRPPSVSLSVPTVAGPIPFTAWCYATASDPDGDPLNYTWNFGDGSSVVSGTSSQINHSYTKAGPFTVTVTVSDPMGASASATAQVHAWGKACVYAISYDGGSQGRCFSGNYLYTVSKDYIGPMSRVNIYDTRNIFPGLLRQLQITDAVDVDVSNNYAYVLVNGLGLLVFDVADPWQPVVQVGSLAIPDANYSLQAIGNYVYVNIGSSGQVAIIDVSNPAAPVRKGTCDVINNTYPALVDQVYVRGSYAYLSVSERDSASNTIRTRLRVLDISNPNSPVVVGAADSPYSSQMELCPSNPIAVYGDYAYLLDGTYLLSFNISNPAAPSLTGFVPFGKNLYDIQVGGNQAFISAGYGYVYVCSLNNPANPALAGIFYSEELASHPAREAGLSLRSGGYVYACSDSNVCAIFYLSNQF